MDVRLINATCILLAAVAGCGMMVGCDSSMGYVDYAEIPGPRNDAQQPTGVADPPAKTNTDDSSGDTEQSPQAEQNSVTTVDNVGQSETADATADVTSDSETKSDGGAEPNTKSAGADTTELPIGTNQTFSSPLRIQELGPPAPANVALEPLEIKLLVPEKRFRKEGDNDALRVSYDDIDLLKVLNMQPVPVDAPKHFPQWLRDLDGKRIRLRGFMYPPYESTGLTWFRLARDNQICCFQREPKVYDVLDVIMADGESTDYIANRPFDVEGIFRIEAEADDTELFRLYRIEDAIVLR